jgi:putative copper export protein
MMYHLAFLLHVLAATIWTGGHIVLSVVVLPKVLKERSTIRLLEFESVYEKIGMPALIIQIITGLYMAHHLLPNREQWTNVDNPITRIIMLKLCLLMLTFAFALDVKLRVLPTLSANTLSTMAWHIIPVTVMSVLFVVVGVSFRTGWLY